MLECWYDNSIFEKICCWVEDFMIISICFICNGQCLCQEVLYFKINEKNIVDFVEMDFVVFNEWM